MKGPDKLSLKGCGSLSGQGNASLSIAADADEDGASASFAFGVSFDAFYAQQNQGTGKSATKSNFTKFPCGRPPRAYPPFGGSPGVAECDIMSD